jgi:hypothetical protein
MTERSERETTREIGRKLIALSNAGRGLDAIDTLYAEKIVSLEPQGSDALPQRMEGLDAVRGKNRWFYDHHEIHASQASGPFQGPRDDQFAVHFALDATFEPTGQRMQLCEVGLYTVAGGKVVQEEFLGEVAPGADA